MLPDSKLFPYTTITNACFKVNFSCTTCHRAPDKMFTFQYYFKQPASNPTFHVLLGGTAFHTSEFALSHFKTNAMFVS